MTETQHKSIGIMQSSSELGVKSLTNYNTLKRIFNWPPSFCYMLGKVFGENNK